MQLILRNSGGCELGRYDIPKSVGAGPADLVSAIGLNNELSSALSFLEPGDTLTIEGEDE